MTPVETTVEFLTAAYNAADLSGHRGKADLFADRLRRAAGEPTLAGCFESILRSMQSSADKIHPPTATAAIGVASSPEAPRILRWVRDQTKLVTLLAATRDRAQVNEIVPTIELPDTHGTGAATPRGDYRITIRARCETPLSHGAEGKAGNATVFRRIQVMTADGGTLYLPYYAGNAVRGQMRDLLADHFCSAIGLTPSRTKPPLALWFFYALYSGGALEEKSGAMKALRKALGDNGASRSAGIREFREHLPGLSLLGCALGNRVLSGRCQVADLRPVCREWGTGDRPASELLGWEFLTRREDHEEHEEHHGMIASTEVLVAGTELEGGIDYDEGASTLERAALGMGLHLLRLRGMLGAEGRRGLGRVALTTEDAPDHEPYEAFLAEKRDEIRAYLREIDALADAELFA